MNSNNIPDKDDIFMTVQIPVSEIYEIEVEGTADPGPISGLEKKPKWLKRHRSRSKPNQPSTIGVRMRKSEFFGYFVKDQKTGRYREAVVEPPGGRKQWLQQRLEDQQNGTIDTTKYEAGQDGGWFSGGLRGFARSAIDNLAMDGGVLLRPH